jgi:hypothetical protein
VKVGDFALLLDPMKRGTTPLVRITEAKQDSNGHVQQITVFDGLKYTARVITSLAVLLPATEEDK